MPTTQPLYMPDFMTGILAALAVNCIPILSLRRSRLDQAFARLNQDIEAAAEAAGLEPKFRIRLHPIHQDSTLVQQALYEAAQRDLVSLDNPEFQKVRHKISQDEAQSYLAGLPGSREMYLGLANRLMCYYRDKEEEVASAV